MPNRRTVLASTRDPGFRPLLVLGIGLTVLACGSAPDSPGAPREAWVDRPVAEWPDFALSNRVVFEDTTYDYLANAFTVDTGADTVGATCKHLFMVFRNHRGTTSISLGDDFHDWTLRSSRDPERTVQVRRLINADPDEPIGDFAGIKDRDWLVFELGERSDGIHPLKIRYTPLERGESIYAVGRNRAQRHDRDPVPSPLRLFRAFGTHYYVQPLDPDIDPVDTSGSPVIDANGHLVGLVSGAVGRLGVVAGVEYLRRQLDRYDIPYRTTYPAAEDTGSSHGPTDTHPGHNRADTLRPAASDDDSR